MSSIHAVIKPIFLFIRTLNAVDWFTFAVAALISWYNAVIPCAELFTSIHGSLFLVFVTAVMFLYAKPMTGLAAAYVAYRLAYAKSPMIPAADNRGKSGIDGVKVDEPEAVPMKQAYVPAEATLEEAIVRRDAPVGEAQSKFIMSPTAADWGGVRPVAANTFGGVPYR